MRRPPAPGVKETVKSTFVPAGTVAGSVGPATAAHAGGWDEKTPRPEHRFLRTGQGGFLSGVVTPTATGANFELRLHDVDGRVVYREQK